MLVAIYSRVSTAEQEKHGYSIGEQQERLSKYADAMGWTVFRHYTDGGFTGANIERPALQELIADVQARKVQKVIVYKLDRLSRSQKDTLYLIEDVFLPNGCDFVSMSESFDTSTPFGKAMIGILSVFAQLEREQIKERLKMGKEGRAKKGLWHGGSAPVGYRYNPATQALEIVETEAEQVRTIFKLFADGYSLHEIEKALEGQETSFGAWSYTHIRKVLHHQTYGGKMKYLSESFAGAQTAIVDEDIFNAVQERLKEHDARWKTNRAPHSKSFLSGMVYCARCGAKYHKYQNGRFFCYSRSKIYPKAVRDPNCKNDSWSIAELEEAVFSELRQLRFNPAELRKRSEPKKDDKVGKLKADIERLRKQRTRLIDLYAAGSIPFDEINSRSETISKAISAAEEKLAAMQEDKKISAEQAALKIEKIGDVLDAGTKGQKEAIVRELIDRIEVDGKTVHIYWNF